MMGKQKRGATFAWLGWGLCVSSQQQPRGKNAPRLCQPRHNRCNRCQLLGHSLSPLAQPGQPGMASHLEDMEFLSLSSYLQL